MGSLHRAEELSVQGTVAPSTGNSGTGSGGGATAAPGGVGGTTTSEDTTSLASLESSAQTNEDDAFVSQQTQLDLENQIYLRNFIAALLQRQAAADAKRTESAQGGGTSGRPTGASVSLQSAHGPMGTPQLPTVQGRLRAARGTASTRAWSSVRADRSIPP